MDLLIVLTYVAFAWAIFKIFRIPVNQWTGIHCCGTDLINEL